MRLPTRGCHRVLKLVARSARAHAPFGGWSNPHPVPVGFHLCVACLGPGGVLKSLDSSACLAALFSPSAGLSASLLSHCRLHQCSTGVALGTAPAELASCCDCRRCPALPTQFVPCCSRLRLSSASSCRHGSSHVATDCDCLQHHRQPHHTLLAHSSGEELCRCASAGLCIAWRFAASVGDLARL